MSIHIVFNTYLVFNLQTFIQLRTTQCVENTIIRPSSFERSIHIVLICELSSKLRRKHQSDQALQSLCLKTFGRILIINRHIVKIQTLLIHTIFVLILSIHCKTEMRRLEKFQLKQLRQMHYLDGNFSLFQRISISSVGTVAQLDLHFWEKKNILNYNLNPPKVR